MSLPATLVRWIPYIAIPLAIFLGMTAWSQHSTISRMEKRIESLETSNTAQTLEAIKALRTSMDKIAQFQGQKEAESKVIQLDTGKTIKEFNSAVKATKQIKTAADSIAAMHNAWAGPQ